MDQDVHVELASSIRQLTEILEDLLKYGRDTAAGKLHVFSNNVVFFLIIDGPQVKLC